MLNFSAIYAYVNPMAVSFLYVFLWIGFFYVYSPKKTLPVKFLVIAFVFGVSSALAAFLLEQTAFLVFHLDTSFLSPFFTLISFRDLLGPIIFSFIFAAVIEETIKFIFMKKYFDSTSVNQVIDGMKIGLATGLGFAFIENIFYFSDALYYSVFTVMEVATIFLLRGAFSTLAHAIYGIIAGYYLSLAKFGEDNSGYFARRALGTSIIAHGFFNFFLIINLGFYSIFMLVFLLVAALLWYNDRKNLELRLMGKKQTLVVPPFLAEKLELEVWKSKHASQAEYLDKLWNILIEVEEKKSGNIH